MYTYQFIVICANNERKELMKKQFDYLNENLNIHYLQASLPSNSKDYLSQISQDFLKKNNINKNIDVILKESCCFLSHVRALEFASKSNYDFSIILEDDVAFYKNNFLFLINNIFENWHEYKYSKSLSIGYIPTRNYSGYLKEHTRYTKLNYDEIVIHNIINSGFQGYIVKNNDIPYLNYLIQPSLLELYNKLNSEEFIDIINKNFSSNRKYLLNFNFNPADVYINILYNQISVFPPLVIEQNIPSLLNHNNEINYWNKYFKDYETEKNKYNI